MDLNFLSLGIAEDISRKLTELGFTVPTPIQAKAIPAALEGKDVIGIAQTGTGKTLAFGLPMIQRLSEHRGTKGLIILPTRELAEQVEATLLKVGKSYGLRTALIIGGAAMGRQVLAMRRQPHIIIGTPGRIVDHLERRTLRIDDVTVLVLDEADRMLDMGFAPQVNVILKQVPKDRQTLLFSATMPRAIATIAETHLSSPVRVEIASQGTVSTLVEQSLIVMSRSEKLSALRQLLSSTVGPVLVFSRTKHGARKLKQSILDFGESAAEIHGNRTLPQRREALEGFKTGRYHVLVATDVAARGIDVSGIELVVNFDLPDQPEDYIHRIGRTARAGKAGRAISFATPDQQQLVRSIERLLNTTIPRGRLGQQTSATRPLINQAVSNPQNKPQSQFNDSRDYYKKDVEHVDTRNRQNHYDRNRNSSQNSRSNYSRNRVTA